jgi:putative restriction endonuclease
MVNALQTWTEIVLNLNPQRSPVGVYPHQPLLVLYLLGRAQRLESNEVAYLEAAKTLKPALAELGPSDNADPLLPFWHLRTSSFWTVSPDHPSVLTRRKGKDRPTPTAMKSVNPVGRVHNSLWELLADSAVPTAVGCTLLAAWFQSSRRARAAEMVGFEHRLY